jgi:hypothetical protein
MKFTANSAKSYQDSSSSIPFSKKILNFERITPFELKPESLAET